LAAALEETVGESGLFYEAHLAQWLAGQRSPASLAGEAQNKLVAAAAQLPLDWANDGGGAAPAPTPAPGGGKRGRRRPPRQSARPPRHGCGAEWFIEQRRAGRRRRRS